MPLTPIAKLVLGILIVIYLVITIITTILGIKDSTSKKERILYYFYSFSALITLIFVVNLLYWGC